MKRGFLKSLSDSRKIKYSTLSVAFCAIVIAIVVMLNSIVSVLGESLGWYLDMTEEQIFSLSDDAKLQLETINQEVELEIVFPFEKDEIDTAYYNSATTGAIGYVHSTAEQIAQACPNVTVSYHDVDKDFAFYTERGLGKHAGDKYVLILRKVAGQEKYAEGDFRSYPINFFFVGDTTGNLYGYNGELMFISALVAMSRDVTPVVYFTTKHGEISFLADTTITFDNVETAVANELIDEGVLELMRIFCDSGFDIKPLDLATIDTSTGKIPDDARMVVINQPDTDFTTDELYLLTRYLETTGTVFCLTRHDVELTNLYATLEANYGVNVETATEAVVDSGTQFGNTKYTLLANVCTHDDSFATSKYFKALNSYSAARARFASTGIIKIDSRFMKKDGYAVPNGPVIYTYPLVETASSAQFGAESGVYNLMSITSVQSYDYENYRYAYLVVCPSSGFASNELLTSTASPNRNMILSLIQSTSNVQTPVNLDFKAFMSYELDITDSQAQTATILLATILPALIVIGGVVVIVRRKHR